MRLWTLHPKYLDAVGLVALWREALLARAVLRGLTRGYRHHPQLARFLSHRAPRAAISAYLEAVHAESQRRGYDFDRTKVGRARDAARIAVTEGQLEHEWRHLMAKLRARSQKDYARLTEVREPDAHPMFRIVRGPIEPWEKT